MAGQYGSALPRALPGDSAGFRFSIDEALESLPQVFTPRQLQTLNDLLHSPRG